MFTVSSIEMTKDPYELTYRSASANDGITVNKTWLYVSQHDESEHDERDIA